MSERAKEDSARKLPSGARFYKCALQVNPFEYLRRHSVPSQFSSEREYNSALIAACQNANVGAIAVTDHYRIYSSESLIECARAAGISVFPGFEALTKEGVHLLCLFDPGEPLSYIDRIIGDCGIHDDIEESPTGDYSIDEFLAKSKMWKAICIAAHVWHEGGILRKLSGLTRIQAWQAPGLLACSIPGPVDDAPENIRPILKNKNAQHRRERPIAIVNAKDVSAPQIVNDLGATTWIKMSDVTLDGLRQAFLDPDSRIRLNSDPEPEMHSELGELTWEGGFLDGTAIQFNPNLNVLIGGRGAGKSTIVESLRYALDLNPLGEEARKSHEGMVRQVLGGGAKISLRVCTYRPAKREYLIERTVPNPPVVRDSSGQILNLLPKEVFPSVEIYGQHEISELARSPEKLTLLLSRFVEPDEGLGRRKRSLLRELESSRQSLLDARSELQQIDERISALPRLEETLKRFQQAGLEEQLREQSLLVREESILESIPARQQVFRECLETLRQELPIDRTFLSEKALEELPGKGILANANGTLERLSFEVEHVANLLEEALRRAGEGLDEVSGLWNDRRRTLEAEYHKILRELRSLSVDGEEFIRLRREIESLRPLRERRPLLIQLEEEYLNRRRSLLVEWEDVKAAEFRLLDRAARQVNRKLRDRVNVEVTAAGNREPLFDMLKDKVGGRLSEAITGIRQSLDLSLPEFVASCRNGAEAVQKRYAIPPSQSEKLASATPETLMRIEELELSSTTAIQLNTAPADAPPAWQALDELSTGQKATAVLLLLLLESEAPLIVDQPEDDLDNRFITEGIVPKMREEKRRRQFIFSTHNANIPVLGDAELILGLTPSGEAGLGRATIRREHMGSLDDSSVRKLVEEILEGGREAFETRRLKYGF